MKDFWDAFLKNLFADFTWARASVWTIFGIIAFVSFAIFEDTTASFRLARFERSLQVIAKLQELDKNGLTRVDTDRMLASLAEQMRAVVIQESVLSRKGSPSWAQRAIAGSIAFCGFAVVFLAQHRRPEERGEMAAQVAGSFVLAVACGIIGAILPPYLWPFLHLIGIPFMVGVIVGIIPSSKRPPNPV